MSQRTNIISGITSTIYDNTVRAVKASTIASGITNLIDVVYMQEEIDVMLTGITIDLTGYWNSAQTIDYVDSHSGSTVDLSNYFTSGQTIDYVATQTSGITVDAYTKSETDTLLTGKTDKSYVDIQDSYVLLSAKTYTDLHSGTTVDLTGYATTGFTESTYQPKGNYLTGFTTDYQPSSAYTDLKYNQATGYTDIMFNELSKFTGISSYFQLEYKYPSTIGPGNINTVINNFISDGYINEFSIFQLPLKYDTGLTFSILIDDNIVITGDTINTGITYYKEKFNFSKGDTLKIITTGTTTFVNNMFSFGIVLGGDLVVSGISNLYQLYDTNIINPQINESLIYDGSKWVNSGITGGSVGSSSLSGLTDVTVDTITSGQVLTYDGSKWVNSGITGGSSAGSVVDFFFLPTYL
jgi:hypothetical protein